MGMYALVVAHTWDGQPIGSDEIVNLQLRRERATLPGYKITVTAHPAVCDALEREEKEALEAASKVVQRRIELKARRDYHLEQFDLTAG